jgi:hypothetical protein
MSLLPPWSPLLLRPTYVLRQRPDLIMFKVAICVSALLLGASLVIAPRLAWGIAALPLAGVVLSLQPCWWLALALCSATLCRAVAGLGLAPAEINFLHFPLVLAAAAMAALFGDSDSRSSRALGAAVVLLLFVSILSWILNTGEPMRPLFNWLVYAEPLLAAYVLLKAPPTSGSRVLLWVLVSAVIFVQVPAAILQFQSGGRADEIQGTFIGQGAGAHLAGALALLGVIMCAARAVTATAIVRAGWLLAACALFSVPIMADANQAVVSAAPGLLIVLLAAGNRRLSTVLLPGLAVACILYGAFLIYPPLQRIANSRIIEQGIAGKWAGTKIILDEMALSPATMLFGLGPGNSVSRVALMSVDGHASKNSPVARLGLQPSPITLRVLSKTQANYFWSSSSAWSAISSWLGLLGDLGLLGSALYLWAALQIWRVTAQVNTWHAQVARGGMIMAAILGSVYSWLEEPGFSLMIAIIAALSASQHQSVYREVEVHLVRSRRFDPVPALAPNGSTAP